MSDHAGWAVLVTVADDGMVLDSRRVELVDAHLPSMPHHHDAQGLPLAQALDLVQRVRLSADQHAQRALDVVVSTVVSPIRGVASRMPAAASTVAERIQNYRAQNVADWVMYAGRSPTRRSRAAGPFICMTRRPCFPPCVGRCVSKALTRRLPSG